MSADDKLVGCALTLIERLRCRRVTSPINGLAFGSRVGPDLLCAEAASALEASEAKIAALTAENATLREKVERAAEDERDRLYERAMHATGTVTIVTPGFLEDNGGAMLPSERAALRQEGKP